MMANAIDLNKANIENLAALWSNLGTEPAPPNPSRLHRSTTWPHRCWFDWTVAPADIAALEPVLTTLPGRSVFPVWECHETLAGHLEPLLRQQGFEVSSRQTAMVLDLEKDATWPAPEGDVATVDGDTDIATWTRIASDAFGYAIDENAIRGIAHNPEAQLLLARIDGEAAATALLYRTGDAIGIHQVGVPPAFRRRGLARTLMHASLERCAGWSRRYVTLQASAAGAGLYLSLGFEEQFEIRNYRRPAS